MLYAIISEDIENSLPLRKQHRAAHLDRLKTLDAEQRLFVAGPHPKIDSEEPNDAGFSGSLIIAEFENLTAAQAWADEDPYVLNGIHSKVVVKPYKKVLPSS